MLNAKTVFMIKFKLKTPKNINNSKLIDFLKKLD